MTGTRREVVAIIVAAGASERMGSVDKLFAPIGGRPVLARVLDTFQACAVINRIVLVVRHQNLARAERLVAREGWTKVTEICAGGLRRQDSVAAGLARAGECGWVVVHDCARPMVTPRLIEDGLEAARDTGAAIAAVPVTDTVKLAEGRYVERTLPRHRLWAAQTPQVFRFDIIAEAYRHAEEDVTDDAMLLERLGYKVRLYTGSYDNIKITTPGDLALARALWRQRG